MAYCQSSFSFLAFQGWGKEKQEKNKKKPQTNKCRDFETSKNWQQKPGVPVDLILCRITGLLSCRSKLWLPGSCAENEALWLFSVFPVQGGLFQMKKKLAKNEC